MLGVMLVVLGYQQWRLHVLHTTVRMLDMMMYDVLKATKLTGKYGITVTKELEEAFAQNFKE